jgi:uncharacterized protein
MGDTPMIIRKDENLQSVVHVAHGTAGPRVVMFSGVHGDEVSGVHALEKLLFDFFAGARTLRRGKLTLVRANEEALKAGRRYIQHNMNRMFRETYAPSVDQHSYEFRRTQELKPLLQDVDYFLDLHSAPIAQEPFLVAEQKSIEFFSQLGISRIMTGWNKFSSGSTGGDTENFANARGALSATLESGSHFEKSSNDVAYRTVVSLLSLLEMIDGEEAQIRAPADVYDVYAVVTKEHEDFAYAGEVRNFQRFRSGEAFATQNRQPVRVQEDTYLLIPMQPADTKVGEEVCYLSRRLAASTSAAA